MYQRNSNSRLSHKQKGDFFDPNNQSSKKMQRDSLNYVEAVKYSEKEEQSQQQQENLAQRGNLQEKKKQSEFKKNMSQQSDSIIECAVYVEKVENGKSIQNQQEELKNNSNSNQNSNSSNINRADNSCSPSDTTHSHSNQANRTCNSSSSSISSNQQTTNNQNIQIKAMLDSGTSSQAQNEFYQQEKESQFKEVNENKQDLEQLENKQENQKQQQKSDYQYLHYVSSNQNNNSSSNNYTNYGSTHNSSKTDSSSNSVKPSKVLLLKIQNPLDDVIEHKVVFEKFQPFGEVEQILIFWKKQPWKIFVDMDSIENAQKAKMALENSYIIVNRQELPMHVQYSNSENLVLKNGNGGINYKDLNKKFEQTHLSYSVKIDPTISSQSQQLYQSSQIHDLNFRNQSQFGGTQSLQLLTPQQNQLLKYADPTSQSIQLQMGLQGQKMQCMSVNLKQQEQQQQYISPQIQQNMQIGMSANLPQQQQAHYINHYKYNYFRTYYNSYFNPF